MATETRSFFVLATVLVAVVAVAAGVLDGTSAGAGALVGGAVMAGSLGMSARVVTRGAPSALAAVLVLFKLPMLGLALYLSMQTFPILPVVVGGSMVVVAAMLLGLLGSERAPPTAET